MAPPATERRDVRKTESALLTPSERDHVIRVLDAYCERRVPLHVRDKVALQFRIQRQDVVLFEKRPRFNRPGEWVESGVAKFRFNRKAGEWSLLYRDRNAKWHYFDPCPPSPEFEALLAEVDRDVTGIFWG